MNSCYSWQARIVNMELHGNLLYNSTPCCSDVVVIAGSLPSVKLVSEQLPLRTAAASCSVTTQCVCILP
jgi:hypothetical protein